MTETIEAKIVGVDLNLDENNRTLEITRIKVGYNCTKCNNPRQTSIDLSKGKRHDHCDICKQEYDFRLDGNYAGLKDNIMNLIKETITHVVEKYPK